MSKIEDITVVIVNYNGIRTVLDTIASVLAMRSVKPRLIVVDDGSTDGSPEAILERYPQVEMHREPRNTMDVNRLRNVGLKRVRTTNVFLTDNDVTFDPDCLTEMLRAMNADDRVAMCIPRMMYSVDPSKVYLAGGRLHYIGATIQPNRDRPHDGRTAPEFGVGGGIALFDTRKLAHVGYFDEGYLLAWGDDAELHQRLLLAGYKTLYVPTAVAAHEHKPFGKERHYRAKWQVHNRWRYILSHYSVRTLLLAAPAFLLYEGMQAAFLTAKGLPHLYITGTLGALRDLPATLRRRREVQSLREVADRDILFAGPIYVRPEHGAGGGAVAAAVGALSRVLEGYWKLISPALARTPSRQSAPAARLEPAAAKRLAKDVKE